MHHQQACTINRHVPSKGMDHQQAFTRTGILIRRLKKCTYLETASTINQHPPSTGMYNQQACTIKRHGPSIGFNPHRHTDQAFKKIHLPRNSIHHQPAPTINRHAPSTSNHHQQACTINRHVPSTGMYHQQAWTINRHGPCAGFYLHRHTCTDQAFKKIHLP